MYWVIGGEYKDTEFLDIEGKMETYGPFFTIEEARQVWWTNTCKQVDNCHHRLFIKYY